MPFWSAFLSMHTWYFMLLPLRPITLDVFLLYPLWWLDSVGWMVPPPHMVVVAMTLITLPNSTDFGTTPRYGRNSRSPLMHGWIYFTEVLTWQQIAYTCICSISWWKGPKMQRCLSTHRQLETKRRQIYIDLRVPDYLLCRSGDSYDVKVLGNQLYSERTPFRNMCNHKRIVLGYLEDHAAIPCRNMCKLKRLFLVTGRITLAAILERSKFCSFLVHQCKIHQTTIM